MAATSEQTPPENTDAVDPTPITDATPGGLLRVFTNAGAVVHPTKLNLSEICISNQLDPDTTSGVISALDYVTLETPTDLKVLCDVILYILTVFNPTGEQDLPAWNNPEPFGLLLALRVADQFLGTPEDRLLMAKLVQSNLDRDPDAYMTNSLECKALLKAAFSNALREYPCYAYMMNEFSFALQLILAGHRAETAIGAFTALPVVNEIAIRIHNNPTTQVIGMIVASTSPGPLASSENLFKMTDACFRMSTAVPMVSPDRALAVVFAATCAGASASDAAVTCCVLAKRYVRVHGNAQPTDSAEWKQTIIDIVNRMFRCMRAVGMERDGKVAFDYMEKFKTFVNLPTTKHYMTTLLRDAAEDCDDDEIEGSDEEDKEDRKARDPKTGLAIVVEDASSGEEVDTDGVTDVSSDNADDDPECVAGRDRSRVKKELDALHKDTTARQVTLQQLVHDARVIAQRVKPLEVDPKKICIILLCVVRRDQILPVHKTDEFARLGMAIEDTCPDIYDLDPEDSSSGSDDDGDDDDPHVVDFEALEEKLGTFTNAEASLEFLLENYTSPIVESARRVVAAMLVSHANAIMDCSEFDCAEDGTCRLMNTVSKTESCRTLVDPFIDARKWTVTDQTVWNVRKRVSALLKELCAAILFKRRSGKAPVNSASRGRTRAAAPRRAKDRPPPPPRGGKRQVPDGNSSKPGPVPTKADGVVKDRAADGPPQKRPAV